MTAFDDWIEKNEKNGSLIVSDNKNGEIYGALFFDHLMETIKHNGNADEFVTLKNNRLRDLYIAEKSKPIENEIAWYSEELNELNNFSVKLRSLNAKIKNFEADVDVLLQMYPPERHNDIKKLLENYVKEGNFDYSYALNKLKSEPKGFFAKLKNGKKIKKANNYLETFINKYEKMNIKKNIDDLSLNKHSKHGLNILKSKFIEIARLDKKSILKCDKEFDVAQTELNNQISSYQQKIEEKKASVKSFEADFTQSIKIENEKDVIKSFVKEVKMERENPKELNVSDYVECLDKMPDSEMVVFNIGLSAGADVLTKIKNIMKQNGLQYGEDINKWLIRKETSENSDKGKYELFSPVLAAKQAKKIMPKLMADFDKADISSGLVVPMKASDLIEKTSEKTELTQAGLIKLVGGAWIKKNMQENPLYDSKTKMERLGFKSENELPEAFFSLEEVMQKFPKDKYLFSGTTASDDYLSFSARAGRNGTIYATPHLNYAAKYDGVTNVGQQEGTTATGDKYVSSIIGKISEKDVKVGFINVYEQSPDDKYFSNFGMEDYRKYVNSDNETKIFDVVEDVGGERKIRQEKNAPNKILSYNQAINGYVGRYTSINVNGQEVRPLAYDSETYVTADKNPIRAKIMHISWGDNEFFMPVPDKPTETMKAILNMRQAKIEDTFYQNGRYDVLVRFQNQAKDFENRTTLINRAQNLLNDGK